jgi:dTDP-4-amino-4,6-dideoxygalactose transaminase
MADTVTYSPAAVNERDSSIKFALNDPPKLPFFPPMRVPLLDLSQQYHRLAEPIRRELDEIISTQHFILGPKGAALEEAIRVYCGAEHAVGVSSGTDAILALLMAMEIGPGDAVITTPFSFFATAGCISRVGATPIFVDIDPATYNISPIALEHYLTGSCRRGEGEALCTPRGEIIRAILPVHLFGLCSEMAAIQQLAKHFQIDVIEDAAQAIGAEYPFGSRMAKAGSMGAAGCFSFYPSKNLGAAGDAGMVVCQDEALANRLRVCRQHGMEPRYYHHFVGGNFRLDEMQAAILSVKLPFLDQWTAARRDVADFYREEFTRRGLLDRLALPAEPYRERGLPNHHIYHQYVIRTEERDALQQHLTNNDIGTAIYYPLGLHEQKCFEYLGYSVGDFPETERAAHETLALPMYPELSRDAQHYVVESIAQFFEKAAGK